MAEGTHAPACLIRLITVTSSLGESISTAGDLSGCSHLFFCLHESEALKDVLSSNGEYDTQLQTESFFNLGMENLSGAVIRFNYVY